MEENFELTPEQEKNEVVKALAQAIAADAKHGRNITIRTGEALPQQEPRTINIIGVIDSPFHWLEKRKDIIDQKQCNIQVSRDSMLITLSIGEHEHYIDLISGRLMLSEEFKRFGINTGNYITGMELSDLIRMNRTCFENKKTAMELVTIMRNFKAKVLNEIENSDDKKGNVSQVRRQTVQGNQPPSFDLYIPIFKGQPKKKFTVEIDIDPETLQATLVSPDAQDLIVETRDGLIDNVLDNIRNICPEIPIIEI
jgi:hypothetical protein